MNDAMKDAPLTALYPETVACGHCGEAAHPWHEGFFGLTVYVCKWCHYATGWDWQRGLLAKSRPDHGGYPQNIAFQDYRQRGWAWPWEGIESLMNSGSYGTFHIKER